MHTCMILPLQTRSRVFGGSRDTKQIHPHYVVYVLASLRETSILSVSMLETELKPRELVKSRVY